MGKAIEIKRNERAVWFTLPNRPELTAIVDIDIFENYIKFDLSWYFKNEKRGKKDHCYIACSVKINGKSTTYYLHWLPIGKNKKGKVIDHKNRNTLDCRTSNLRHATHSVNSRNSSSYDLGNGSFRYKGVCVCKTFRSYDKKQTYQAYKGKKYIASALTIREVKKRISNKLQTKELTK